MPLAPTRPSLWYERRGQGEPLLCITGFGISSAVFEPVLDLYTEQVGNAGAHIAGDGSNFGGVHDEGGIDIDDPETGVLQFFHGQLEKDG